MYAVAPLAFYLTGLMVEPEANRYSEFWILSPGFYSYIISAEPDFSELAQRTNLSAFAEHHGHARV